MEEGVDLGRGQLVEAAVAAARMVDDEDVERSELVGGRGDELRRRRGIGEVHLCEGRPQLASHGLGASGLRAPVLRLVVLGPALDEDGGAGVAEAPRDRVADPGAAADARDERVPTLEAHRLRQLRA